MATAKELAQRLEAKRGEMKSWMDERTTADGYNFQGDDLKSFNDRNDELAKINDDYVQAMAVEKAARDNEAALKEMKSIDRTVPFGAFNGSSSDGSRQPAIKTVGEMFMESEAYKSNAETPPSVRPQWSVELPLESLQQAEMKATLTTSTGATGYGLMQPGVVPYATRRPVLRDLMPVSQTTEKYISYIEQTTQTFGADTVAEGASKPETTLGTTRRQFNMETIAHYIKVTNQALDFIPGIRDLINQQGTLGLQLAEEEQILNGSGTTPDIQGFLTKTGVQTQAVGSDDQFTAFIKAMTKVQSDPGYANVTGGVINPLDWQRIITLKDTTGRFIYGDPFAATQAPRIWGVPLVPTPAITEGTSLLGDFLMFSRLWLNGGIRIIVGYVNDDLIKNQQTIVIEEYAALEIDRATAFCKVTGLEV